MLGELFIYILIGLLFLSTLILPIGNYNNHSKDALAEDKINESMEYIRSKSQNELEDYTILANDDYIFISKTSTEDDEDEFDNSKDEENIEAIENIVEQFKLDKRYFYNKLDDDQKKYKGYKVIAEFRNGVQIYPKIKEEQNEKYEEKYNPEG